MVVTRLEVQTQHGWFPVKLFHHIQWQAFAGNNKSIWLVSEAISLLLWHSMTRMHCLENSTSSEEWTKHYNGWQNSVKTCECVRAHFSPRELFPDLSLGTGLKLASTPKERLAIWKFVNVFIWNAIRSCELMIVRYDRAKSVTNTPNTGPVH